MATKGNDSNLGKETTPWRTIANAVAAAQRFTIVIHGGTYREGSITWAARSSRSSRTHTRRSG